MKLKVGQARRLKSGKARRLRNSRPPKRIAGPYSIIGHAITSRLEDRRIGLVILMVSVSPDHGRRRRKRCAEQ